VDDILLIKVVLFQRRGDDVVLLGDGFNIPPHVTYFLRCDSWMLQTDVV